MNILQPSLKEIIKFVVTCKSCREPRASTQTWTSSVTWLSWGVPVPRRPGKAGRDEAGQGRRQLRVHQYRLPDQTNQPDLLYKA